MELHLQTFGAKLRQRNQLFKVIVTDLGGGGDTVEEFAPHQVEAILLQQGTSVTTDALLFAIEHGIDVHLLDGLGEPKGRIFANRPTNTIAVWKKQLHYTFGLDGLRMAKDWVEQKMRGELTYLQNLKNRRSGEKLAHLERAEADISDLIARLSKHSVRDFEACRLTIQGYEGTAHRIYLAVLAALVPEEYRFDGRSRPASDLFNAFLNYGYGILYRKVERALVLAGVSPYIGFMHADGHQRPSLLYDFIEPFRIWVEKTVFKLFAAKLPNRRHVWRNGEKGLWLNEEGKRLLTGALLKRLREKREPFRDGRQYSLDKYLRERAKGLATHLMDWKPLFPATVLQIAPAK